MDDWASLFSSRSMQRQWKEGRSAYSLADFIMNHDGAASLKLHSSSVLSESVTFEHAIPEFEASFDSYQGQPSRLDFGVCGQAGPTQSLFVGVEAKVDEPFGNTTVGQRYGNAVKTRCSGKRTNAPDRVKGLLSRYFSDYDDPRTSKFSGIRYQLLTAAAGTAAVHKDVSVLYVLVFKTRLYDEQKGAENHEDYERFVDCAGGKSIAHDASVSSAHQLMLGGMPLTCIYQYVDVES